MKTLREWILDEHRAVEPRLNRLQDAVLTAAPAVAAPLRGVRGESRLLSFPSKVWCELIWPSRHTWAGLAAVWLVIAAVNVVSKNPAELTRPAMAAMPLDALSLWQLQRQMLADVSVQTPAIAKKAEPKLPQPGEPRAVEWLVREHGIYV